MTRPPRDTRIHKRGFTMLEILVATIISAFVALTAVASLQTVISSRDKIDANINAAAELNCAAQMISDDLRNIARKTGDGGCNLLGVLIPLDGTISTNLTVQAVNRIKARPEQAEGDVYEVEYYLTLNDDKPQLMRRVWPYPNAEDDPGGILTCIAEHVISFDVSYYDGDGWQREWPDDMTELPHLVEVMLAAELPDYKKTVRRGVLVNFPRRPGRAIEPSTDIDATDETAKDEADLNEE